MIYYILLGISSSFLIYTLINLVLTIKFINSLSVMLKDKYINEIKSPKIIFIISCILFLAHFIISVTIAKFLLLIVVMILNVHLLSEMSFFKEYI